MTTDEDSDAEVLAAAQSGDGRSFAVLFDRHRDRVFGHALRLTRVRADAEDVTAVVFLEAWRRRDRVRLVDGSAVPWLLVTTNNVARNLTRAAIRYRAALDAIPRVYDATEPTGFDADIRGAISALPLIDQQLLGLTMEGYKAAEAAKVLNISPGNARTRLSRARQRLRESLHPLDRSGKLQEGAS